MYNQGMIPRNIRNCFLASLWLAPFFVTVFYLLLKISLQNTDPDLGWHLRIAKDAIELGIFPDVDRYSFALPQFPWVVFEFRLEELMYLIFRSSNFLGLSLFFATVTTTLLSLHTYLTTKILGASRGTVLVISSIFSLGLLSSYGVRTTVFALWANIILFWLIYAYINNRLKPIICYSLLVFCFFIWANCHPSFFLGWLIFAGATGYKFISQEREWRLQIILLITFGATLLNPFGFRLWAEVLGHFTPSSVYLHRYIQEWRPFFLTLPLDFAGMGSFFAALLLLLSGKKTLLKDGLVVNLGVTLLFGLATLTAIRNLPLFMVWALPLATVSNPNNFRLGIAIPNSYKALFGVLLTCLLVPQILVLLPQADGSLWENNYPSAGAINALKEAAKGRKIFNPYAWGGQLAWYFGGDPKIFIDGRMPATWYQGDNFPFKDYVLASKGSALDKARFFNKYNFGVTIVEKVAWRKLDWLNELFIGGKVAEEKLAQEAEAKSFNTWLRQNADWEIIYEDDTTRIFVKND